MTMTEAVLGARQKHKRSCEGGQSGHPELRARVGLLSPSLPPSTLSVSGGHRCLYASLSLALSPPHLKVSLQFNHGDLVTIPGRPCHLLVLRGSLADVPAGCVWLPSSIPTTLSLGTISAFVEDSRG